MTALIESQAEIVGKLKPLAEARERTNAAKAESDLLGEQVKSWMLLNEDSLDRDERGRPYIEDGEHGIRFFLNSTKGSDEWDIRTADPKLVARLAEQGLLNVKTKAFDERRKSAPATYLDDAMRYRHETAGATRLEREK